MSSADLNELCIINIIVPASTHMPHIIFIIIIIITMALAENPIRTKSHICDFAGQYGLMFVIIVIIIIITRPKPAYGRRGLAGSGAKIQMK